jgi:alginate O-acetyltransferase complex protein AlgJ
MTDKSKKRTREEIALIEVGHTDVTRAQSLFLSVMFVLTILFVPTLQWVAGSRSEGGLRAWELLPNGEEWKTLLLPAGPVVKVRQIAGVNARMLGDIHAYETQLEDTSIVVDWLLPRVGGVLIGRLGAGNESAYCGREGWLFYRPGIDYVVGDGFLEPKVMEGRRRAASEGETPVQPDPIAAIVEFRDRLRERGVELVIVPAPGKLSIEPDRFSGRHAGPPEEPVQNPSWKAFVAAMAVADVRLFDPAPHLLRARGEWGASVYLDTDTHWTPRAMELTARELAAYLRAEGLVAQGAGGEEAIHARHERSFTNHGDIAAMLKLREDQTYYPRTTVKTHEIASADGAPWQPREDADVLLLGDSFANIFSLEGMGWGRAGGLAEQLSFELQRPLDAIRRNDAGAHATRGELCQQIRRGRDRLTGKRLVIWEFAARELAVGDWKMGFDYSAPETGATTTTVPPDATVPLTIEATVAEASTMPRPGTVPYRDAVMALHLTDLSPADAGDGSGSLLAFAWGMRNNVLLPLSRVEPGARLRLRMQPWREVEKLYGSYNRIELDDPDLLLLEPYWVEPTDGDAPASAGQ